MAALATTAGRDEIFTSHATRGDGGRREASAPEGARTSMPSRKHQRLVVLLTEYPRLLVELARSCPGIDMPDVLELLPGPETVRFPTTERTADGAVLVRRNGGGIGEAFVLEVQLEKEAEKHIAWPAYVVGTAARLRCPTTLVVVAGSERVARWASQPIDLGHGRAVIQPLVVGPRQIPSALTLEEARERPDRLALSVIIHGHERGSLGLNRMAVKIARELLARGDHRSKVLADLIVGSGREEVRRMERAEDTETGWGKTFWFGEIGKAVAKGWAEGRRTGRVKGKAEGLAKGKAEGLAKGKAEGLAAGLRTVLRARRLEPTARQQARIDACRDRRQLQQWLRRALVAEDVEEIFGR